MKEKQIVAWLVLMLPLAVSAQTIHFETNDFKQLGVYDTWEASPFRTGELKGNYGIVDNHLNAVDAALGKAPNGSKKMLAFQRSRFGSNTLGVRIDLNETFQLTAKTRYIHLMVHRPYGGRVMVIGLGKRRDRVGQSEETEQFWAMTTKNVLSNRWEEVVLPIKGNGGIDIYSLVVVPDCESPHHYTEDKICYIDQIEINEHPQASLVYGYYPLNLDKDVLNKRGDFCLTEVMLEGGKEGRQSISFPVSNASFYQVIHHPVFMAQPGDWLTPKICYQGKDIHTSVCADWNDDGFFEDAESEARGEKNTDTLKLPAFRIPADLVPGYYRLRLETDGGIVDFRLNVHGEFCHVNDANRNGEVLAADGSKLVKYQTEFGQPFTIRMHPEKGFEYAGMVVKHGYRLSSDSIVHENVQWEKLRVDCQQFNENDEFTIPGKYMNGDVEIEGLFIEKGTSRKP